MRQRSFLRLSGFSVLTLCTFRGSAPAADAPVPDPLAPDLKKLLPQLMDRHLVPGLSIALVRDGAVSWSQGFGFKNRQTRDPVDDATLFEAASVSKTVLAYLVVKLSEERVLDLDKPLSSYAPELFEGSDEASKQINARQALSHTTGLPEWRTEPALKTRTKPGTTFLYSGEGYFLLQSVVTKLRGKFDHSRSGTFESDLTVYATDIDQTIKRELLEPMGLTSSGYVWNETLKKHSAHPHDAHGQPLKKGEPTPVEAARYAAAGGLHTTAGEYAKLLSEILAPKQTDRYRLMRKNIEKMLTPQVKLPADMKIDGADSWALGWAVQERKTGPVIVHSGGQTGFRSLTMGSPKTKSGFIILTNSDNGAKICYDPELAEKLNTLLEP